MKVGTDGALLGAWAQGGRRILDIGTGTGVVALMMAQRFPDAMVDAVDVDVNAVGQASENFAQSPFADRLSVSCMPVQQLALNPQNKARYDAIVANPPYFNRSLISPDAARTTARHALSLSYEDLFLSVSSLLSQDGTFSVVIPFDCIQNMLDVAAKHGFFVTRRCDVRTTPKKMPKRHLLTFTRQPSSSVTIEDGVVESSPGVRSEWYQKLMADFYL